ncbi:manganese efflux pump MntP family protein [Clostridium saccharobutylicum]|uniref:Putative manganese efflux pump MntP n=1 Tax=Clostridium saccharobutylicum TaxID=169679 RepID=A0A1S8N4M6_CLOSA|nr:manganese efflux pump MntP family protein [Clostridium saccharobutylicum]OOM11365.1 putative manganese efflux pump MntP [Clostridium saccharobutylicum]
MSILSLILTAIGLSMDAFAVSLTTGFKISKDDRSKIALKAGMYFGGFQALMPLIGWILGVKFTKYIQSVDHWIAFVLLTIIGGKMIFDGLKGEEDNEFEDIHSNKKFLLLAIATSIDALAVGVTFAFLGINIIKSITIIGVVTFILSIIAVYIGKILGNKLTNKSSIVGGAILIFIGLEILVEHLGLFVK